MAPGEQVYEAAPRLLITGRARQAHRRYSHLGHGGAGAGGALAAHQVGCEVARPLRAGGGAALLPLELNAPAHGVVAAALQGRLACLSRPALSDGWQGVTGITLWNRALDIGSMRGDDGSP